MARISPMRSPPKLSSREDMHEVMKMMARTSPPRSAPAGGVVKQRQATAEQAALLTTKGTASGSDEMRSSAGSEQPQSANSWKGEDEMTGKAFVPSLL